MDYFFQLYNYLTKEIPSVADVPSYSTAAQLCDRIFSETKDIHAEVEQHPFVKALLKKELPLKVYHAHAVDLRHFYNILETEIRTNLSTCQRLSRVYFEKLERTPFLDKDLSLPLFQGLSSKPSAAAIAYGKHLTQLGRTNPLLLISHSYVRYLGDLSGGKILKSVISKKWPDAVNFYDFSSLYADHENAKAFKDLYKERINGLALTLEQKNELILECSKAFELSGALFEACYPAATVTS